MTGFTVGGSLARLGSGAGLRLATVAPPLTATAPVISGTASYSGNLTITSAATFKGPYLSTGQSWLNNGQDSGQTGSVYTKTTNDAGDQIALRMFATGPGGSVYIDSNTITIVGLLSFSSGPLPQGQAGAAYSFTLTATGGTAPYTYAISALPTGLTLNPSTGAITGTPTVVGDTLYSATVTDANGLTAPLSGTCTISTTPVGAITDLSATTVTASSIQLAFSAATNATSYQYRLNGGAWIALPSDNILVGLSSSTTYTVEVRGVNAFGNGSASNAITPTTASSSAPTPGLSYTPSFVPAFTFRSTAAALLTDLGLTAGQVIKATDYANFEVALAAANAAQKPLIVGIDSLAYTFTTISTRVYVDVDIYGYGAVVPKITGASRLTGYLCHFANDIKIYGIEFKDFTQVYMWTPASMPLVRPDDSGYNAATSPAVRSPYHTSTDPLVVACLGAVDAGFITQACGHISVSGSPTVSSIKPVRMKQDPGAGAANATLRVAYNSTVAGKSYKTYDIANPSGASNWAAALDGAPPDLLASSVVGATNASLAAAINANTAASGYSAQIDPRTGNVVVLRGIDWRGNISVTTGGTLTVNSTSSGTLAVGMTVCCVANNNNYAFYLTGGSGSTWTVDVNPATAVSNANAGGCTNWARPVDWTITNTGGTVVKDAVGPAIDMSYCKFSGCDRAGGGIGDTTAVGRIDFHKNTLAATWGAMSYNVLNWTEVWAANNSYTECLISGGTYGPVSGRTAGNSQTKQTNQDGTFIWIGSNDECFMRYIQARGGTKFRFENNLCQDIEGNTNKDTVNSAVIVDVRNVWDTTANKRDNHTFSYNLVTNVKNVLGAIDCNVFYMKGSSFTLVGNVVNGFGGARQSSYRGVISSGSECAGFLFKNNGEEVDSNGQVYIANNYFVGGPNGLPWVKWDDFGGNFSMVNNHLAGWTAQLDDATLNTATGRALNTWVGDATVLNTSWAGTVTASGTTTLTINTTTSGAMVVGMTLRVGTSSRTVISGSGSTWTLSSSLTASGASATASATIATVNSTTSGSLAIGMRLVVGSATQTIKAIYGSSYVMNGSMSASGAATADYVNMIDGGLIRGYQRTVAVKLVSNYFENIADQGQVTILLNSLTNAAGTAGSFANWEFSNNIAKNDGTSAYPAHTGQEDWAYLNNTPAGIGSVSTLVLGRNAVQNAAGATVGAISFRFGSTYSTDNGNSTLKPYVPVP